MVKRAKKKKFAKKADSLEKRKYYMIHFFSIASAVILTLIVTFF